jgi:alpha-1,2-mannosyltransferase
MTAVTDVPSPSSFSDDSTHRMPELPRETTGVSARTIGDHLKRTTACLSSRRLFLVLLGAISFAFLAYGLVAWWRGWPLGVDSSVYRAGALLFVHGRSPYSRNDLGYLHYSFTYPPAAALLFAPLAVLPAQVAWAFMAAASVLALALVIHLSIAAMPRWRFPVARSTLLLTLATLGLVPVWRTVGLGQVNILLMAMVACDVLVVSKRGSRWGGLLTGVAAAVKLVPLVFIVHLFVTGKRRAALRALAVFTGLQAFTLLLVPPGRAYWTTYMFQTDRIGPAQWPANQSLNGFMARVADMSPWSSHAAWAIGALLALPALMLLLRYHRRGREVEALCVTACFGLLVAPVSWLPCWVWIVPIVIALLSWLQAAWWSRGPRQATTLERWAGAGAIFVVIAVFASTYWVPTSQQRHRTLGSFWFLVLANPYVLSMVALGVVLWRSSSARSPLSGVRHRTYQSTPTPFRPDMSLKRPAPSNQIRSAVGVSPWDTDF